MEGCKPNPTLKLEVRLEWNHSGVKGLYKEQSKNRAGQDYWAPQSLYCDSHSIKTNRIRGGRDTVWGGGRLSPGITGLQFRAGSSRAVWIIWTPKICLPLSAAPHLSNLTSVTGLSWTERADDSVTLFECSGASFHVRARCVPDPSPLCLLPLRRWNKTANPIIGYCT